MRDREIHRADQRWARQGLFRHRRRRLPWTSLLLALVLGALALALALGPMDLGGRWGGVQRTAPLDGIKEPAGDRLPLPPPPLG